MTQKNQTTSSEEKWYELPHVMDYLKFFLPPIGLYFLFKSKKMIPLAWKIIVGIMMFIGVLLLLINSIMAN